MKSLTLRDIIIFLLLLLFTYTAASKIIENNNFVAQMALSPAPFMKTLAPFFGWAIPLIEGIIVLTLLTSKFRFYGLWASLLLLISFEVYIIAMLASGKHLPCACGGIIAKMSWAQHVGFNAFFIILNLIAIIRYNNNKAPVSESSDQAGFDNILRA